ncbi:MAG: hypothetical protein WDN69_16315 [Aliidongia sp.]
MASIWPTIALASGAPDLFGITPGMDVTTASQQALAQIHPSRFINIKFSTGQVAGFKAMTDAQGGGRSEGFRVDTPSSGVVTFLSRAVDFGRDIGPPTDDLLRDLEAKYGRYSSREIIGSGLVVLIWRYGKDWQIQGSAAKECSAVLLKSDISGSLPLYGPPDKARNCDPFMRVAIQSNPDSKTVKNYSITIFDEKRMYQETNPAVAAAATH